MLKNQVDVCLLLFNMVMVRRHMISSHLLNTNSWQVYDTNIQIPVFWQPGFFFFLESYGSKIKITGDEERPMRVLFV